MCIYVWGVKSEVADICWNFDELQQKLFMCHLVKYYNVLKQEIRLMGLDAAKITDDIKKMFQIKVVQN